MLLRIVRWWVLLLGGALLGAGLFLHGQVAIANEYLACYENTFFLWREIGKATFFLQSTDHRVALALAQVPPDVIEESQRAAWALMVVGGMLAVTAPFVGSVHRKLSGRARVRRRMAPVNSSIA
jgi:hypothetical protein